MNRLIAAILLVFLLEGCSAKSAALTPTQLPVSPTSTASPASTSTPTSTTTPTLTETPVPTATPTPRTAINPIDIEQITLLNVMAVIGGRGVAWSPDGKSIALVNEIGVSIFNADDLTQQLSFPIKGGAAYVLYNADGAKLAISDGRYWGKILDASTGQVLLEFTNYNDVIDFCPDGKILTSYYGPDLSGKMACASVETHTKLTNTRRAWTIIASPDETMAATGGMYDDAQVIELPSGNLLQSVKGSDQIYQTPMVSLGISPDDQTLVTANIEGTNNFWNIATGEQVHTIVTPDYVSNMAFSPDGSCLVLVSATSLQVVTMSDFQVRQAGGVSPGKVDSISFSPDGKLMATGSETGPVLFWSTENWQETHLNLDDNLGGRDIVFSPNGTYLVSMNKQKTIQVWDINSGKVLLKLDASPYWFGCAIFSPDSTKLAIGTAGYEKNGDLKNFQAGIQIWDVASSKLITTLVGHPYSSADQVGNEVVALAYSPDGKILASSGGYYDNKIHLWDTETWQQTSIIAEHGIYNILFSPDGNTLFTSSGEGLELWDFRNKETIRTLLLGSPFALSPDGQLIADVVWKNMIVRVFQVENGKLAFQQQLTSKSWGSGELAIAFSPDGGLLAVGGWDGGLRIFGLP